MLLNDSLGDCVIAGGEHEHLLWNKEAGKAVVFDDKATVKNYGAIGGYNGTPDTDNGCDMQVAADYRKNTGLVDAKGQRHKIGAYVELAPGNLTELYYATYLFDGVGIGINVTNTWINDFPNKPWDAADWSAGDVAGGHYVPAIAKRGGDIIIVTWGATQVLTPAGYQAASDEAFAYLTEEKLVNGKDLDGFSLSDLRADLAAVAAA